MGGHATVVFDTVEETFHDFAEFVSCDRSDGDRDEPGSQVWLSTDLLPQRITIVTFVADHVVDKQSFSNVYVSTRS